MKIIEGGLTLLKFLKLGFGIGLTVGVAIPVAVLVSAGGFILLGSVIKKDAEKNKRKGKANEKVDLRRVFNDDDLK